MSNRQPRTPRQIALFNERMAAAVLRDAECYGISLDAAIELRQENFRPWLRSKFNLTASKGAI